MTTPCFYPIAQLAPDHVREVLERADLESPHAFVRGLNADYDRDIYIQNMLRPLPTENDFRFVHGTGKSERWVLLERLAWDSEFFGYGVAKLHAVIDPNSAHDARADSCTDTAAVNTILEEARRSGIRYVFCTVAPRELFLTRTLSDAQFTLIETRCHYHKQLDAPPLDRYDTRLATAADAPSLALAAREMVNWYDRFHADPAIDLHDADRLMERWVHASLEDGFADLTVVPNVSAPEAFCTARLHREHWAGWGMKLAQPVLSAVSPKHRGWYVKIISELCEQLRQQGADHAYLITQITNNAVIRSWEKLGFHFGKGEHVFRRTL